MPRRLILMRHAKSAWDTDAATDHERPLGKRGRRDAPRIAGRLVELGWAPEVVLSSDSARTRETYALMEEAFDGCPQAVFVRSFYEGDLDDLRQQVAEVPDEVATVLALGHNPGWQEALYWLSGSDESLTTANAALLEADAITWRDALAAPRSWKLRQLLRPKEL